MDSKTDPKYTNNRDIAGVRREVDDDIVRTMVPTSVALTVTGLSSGKALIKWCEKNNVRHYKRNNRWVFDKEDLLLASL